jgi:hypothetical protein
VNDAITGRTVSDSEWVEAHCETLADVVNLYQQLREARAELAKVDQVLAEYGISYPTGSRGVSDLADQATERLEELHRLDPEHWAAP